MRLRVGVATDIGRVREKNEDSYLVEEPLFAVADGMGGHKGGDVASQLALETIEGEPAADLAQRLRDANAAVFERSQSDRSVTGMGTTVTAVVVKGTSALFAHVGDSRAYLLRAGDLRQLTDDHTLVARMVKTGEITEAEAEVHPHRSVLTRALGTEPDVIVDEFDVALTDGDRLLLCSDGLTGMVTEEQIVAILSAAPEPAGRGEPAGARREPGRRRRQHHGRRHRPRGRGRRGHRGAGLARDPEPPAAAARGRPDRAGAADPRRRRHRAARLRGPAVVRGRVRRPRRRVPRDPGRVRGPALQPPGRHHRDPGRRRRGHLLLRAAAGGPHRQRPRGRADDRRPDPSRRGRGRGAPADDGRWRLGVRVGWWRWRLGGGGGGGGSGGGGAST